MKEAERLREKLENYTKERKFKLNSNEKIVATILNGLLKNKDKKGEIYCPCRIPTGNKEEDKNIICPCKFHEQEIKKTGHCKCNLFVINQKDDVPLHLKRWSLKRHSSFGCKKNQRFFCTENLKILLCSRSDHAINGMVFCHAS